MSRDDIDQIPSIVPQREGVAVPSGKRRRKADRGQPTASPARNGGGAGLLARLFITLALAAAAVACAWAWQLQTELELARGTLTSYEGRIADLEARLSDTDEGMNQNAAVQAAKIKELDSEVRKLWDNVWAKSKERFGKLEASTASQAKSMKRVQADLATIQTDQERASKELAKLKSVAGDLSRLMASAKASQAEVERVADTLNRINLDLAKLNQRVEGNEEWVGSINAFRRQINASVTELQSTIRALQAAPQ